MARIALRIVAFPLLLAACGTLDLGAGRSVAQAGPASLAWRLSPDAFAQYDQTVHARSDSRLDGYARWGEIEDVAGFHGYELSDDRRRVTRPITHVQLLYVPFVFTLPPSSAPGTRLDLKGTLPWNWRLGPIEVQGGVEVVPSPPGDVPGSVRLVGRVLLAGRGADPQEEPHRLLRAATLTWTSVFDPARGAVVQAEFSVAATSVAGTTLRPRSAHFMDPGPHSYRARIGLSLRRIWEHRAPGFQREVDAAIEDGLSYLESQQMPSGAFGRMDMIGPTALALLALVDGGRDPEAPAVARGFDWLLDQPTWSPAERRNSTYELGIALMALERRRTPPEETGRRARGERSGFLPRTITPRERVWMEAAVEVLLATAVVEGPDDGGGAGRPVTGDSVRFRWGYPLVTDGDPRPEPRPSWDNSNTQYAVLGLESAARCAVRVPRRVWVGIAQHYLAAQATDGPQRRGLRLTPHARKAPPGSSPQAPASRSVAPAEVARERGWAYGMATWTEPGRPPTGVTYGSMTTAGIASLAIARSRLVGEPGQADLVARIDEGLRDGWAALDRMFSVWTNPRYEGWYFYYLYGLERAGMLSDVERVGIHDWYWEGAVQLLLRRGTYGTRIAPRWVYDFTPEVSTAWAVLFLKRGTPPVVTPR